ncbi:MAG: YkvA family protein [Actinomycetota bacterium]
MSGDDTLARSAPRARPDPTSLKEYALLLPRLVRLLWRLSRDPRVPARAKATLFIIAGYLLSPIDVVPDFVPGIGQLDDIVVVAFALDQMLNRVPDEVVRDHWDGDEDVLEVVRQVLDIATAYVPGWLKKRFSSR